MVRFPGNPVSSFSLIGVVIFGSQIFCRPPLPLNVMAVAFVVATLIQTDADTPVPLSSSLPAGDGDPLFVPWLGRLLALQDFLCIIFSLLFFVMPRARASKVMFFSRRGRVGLPDMPHLRYLIFRPHFRVTENTALWLLNCSKN